MKNLTCLYCGNETRHVTTLALLVPNKYFTTREAAREAIRRPHILQHCPTCGSFMLGIVPFSPAELFAGEYAFAPVSASWHAHCVELARDIKDRLLENAPNERGVIYDIGGNDGALSSVMYKVCDRLTIVIDPSDVAPFQNGVHWPKRKGFFREKLALELLAAGDRKADAITATNVLAHVPDPLDFMRGVKALLAPDGVAVFEFPDGADFGERVLFDLLYAEHLGYITFQGVSALAERAGLRVDDVKTVATHGGSLRVFIRHANEVRLAVRLARRANTLPDFAESVAQKLFTLAQKTKGKNIIGFGSAAKSVVVNACYFEGMSEPYAVPNFIIDETPAKIGRFQPGSGAKILPLPISFYEAMQPDEKLAADLLSSADVCINYAWNYKDEAREKLARAGFRGEIVTVHD